VVEATARNANRNPCRNLEHGNLPLFSDSPTQLDEAVCIHSKWRSGIANWIFDSPRVHPVAKNNLIHELGAAHRSGAVSPNRRPRPYQFPTLTFGVL
jgi:hypothetical protein